MRHFVETISTDGTIKKITRMHDDEDDDNDDDDDEWSMIHWNRQTHLFHFLSHSPQS
jgi:hypothetical protein